VGLFEPADGNLTPATFIIDEGSLALSALSLSASLTIFIENTSHQRDVTLVGSAEMAYTRGWPTSGTGVGVHHLPCGHLLWRTVGCDVEPKTDFGGPGLDADMRSAGTISILRAWRHDRDFGFLAHRLAWLRAPPRYLYWRRYRRWSPGVITSAGGSFCGLVFPVSTLMDIRWPALHINQSYGIRPSYFVASA